MDPKISKILSIVAILVLILPSAGGAGSESPSLSYSGGSESKSETPKKSPPPLAGLILARYDLLFEANKKASDELSLTGALRAIKVGFGAAFRDFVEQPAMARWMRFVVFAAGKADRAIDFVKTNKHWTFRYFRSVAGVVKSPKSRVCTGHPDFCTRLGAGFESADKWAKNAAERIHSYHRKFGNAIDMAPGIGKSKSISPEFKDVLYKTYVRSNHPVSYDLLEAAGKLKAAGIMKQNEYAALDKFFIRGEKVLPSEEADAWTAFERIRLSNKDNKALITGIEAEIKTSKVGRLTDEHLGVARAVTRFINNHKLPVALTAFYLFPSQMMGITGNILNMFSGILAWFSEKIIGAYGYGFDLLVPLLRMNPDVEAYKSVADLFIAIMGGIFIIAITITGGYMVMMSSTPGGRAKAKDMFLKLILGMILVSFSPYIYSLILGLSQTLTNQILYVGSQSVSDEAFRWMDEAENITGYSCDGITDQTQKNMCTKMKGLMSEDQISNELYFNMMGRFVIASRANSAGLTQLVSVFAMILAEMILTLRVLLVAFFGVIFPVILFLYFFGFTKSYGQRLLKTMFMVIFLQVVMALIVAVLVIGTSHISGFETLGGNEDTISMREVLTMGAFAAMVLIPVMMDRILGYAGGAVMGITMVAEVGGGRIMAGGFGMPMMSVSGMAAGFGPAALGAAGADMLFLQSGGAMMGNLPGEMATVRPGEPPLGKKEEGGEGRGEGGLGLLGFGETGYMAAGATAADMTYGAQQQRGGMFQQMGGDAWGTGGAGGAGQFKGPIPGYVQQGDRVGRARWLDYKSEGMPIVHKPSYFELLGKRRPPGVNLGTEMEVRDRAAYGKLAGQSVSDAAKKAKQFVHRKDGE